ncbi:MAG TPA: transglycosylase domain-containing protein, partial [Anaerolineales bacterium]|nr:transglycosylase domain-containing protein [Anaerolineales bacterium]
GVISAVAYAQVSQDLPNIEILPQYFEPPNGLLLQPTRLVDRSGEHILLVIQNPRLAPASINAETIAQYRRNFLPIQPSDPVSVQDTGIEYLPTNIITTTIAIADPEFWKHPGFTLQGFFKTEQKTLSQQLAASLLLDTEPPGFLKAIRERLLAAQITSHFGREKILEWYLNSAAYGRFSYGIDEASRLYFDKPASQLSLAEAAVLAAVSQSPTLNPHDAPQAALERQKFVIQEMLRLRLISPEEGVQAALEKLNFSASAQPGKSLLISVLEPQLAPAFVNLAVAELDTIVQRSRLERGGFIVQTTLDYALQVQANCLISAQQAQLKSPGEQTQPANCQAFEYIEPLEFDQDPIPTSPQAEAIVLNPQNGQVMAFAADPLQSLQPGYLPAHPSGSLSTPFIYLTAFTRGMSPASLVWDTPFETDLIVRNPDNLYHGPLRLRIAMANDYLVAAQKVLEQVGLQNVLQITRQLGINPATSNTTTPVNSEDLLGRVDILQIGRAYGIFANQGLLAGKENAKSVSIHPDDSNSLSPVTIFQISQSDQSVIFHQATESKSRPIISPQLAYLVNHILSDEAARWASLGHPNPLETGYPLAAKMNQTLDGNSNWVIGYSTDRVVGVWLGSDDSLAQVGNQPQTSLSNAAAGLWHALAKYTMQASPGVRAFPVPDGISSLSVCDPSGMLPDDDCPNTVSEVFLPGNEPVQADTLFQTISVNRQTGHLATVFTPVDLVEERVYMMVPQEEHTWIKQSGIPIPPQTHDIVPSDPPSSPEVQLLSPVMFNTVSGEFAIEGIVSLSGLDFFRVQIGQGLNPQSWLQIGDDFSQSNQEPFRVVWDTTGLDGVYTIQLIAVHQDQSIQRAAILVTIDNQAPKITIEQPYPGEILSAPKNEEFIFQADVQDNLGIQKVEFYLDGKILAGRFVSPFIATWRPVIGEHTLKIIAIDQAGNQTSTETSFTIQ